jgi:hypothetical protein
VYARNMKYSWGRVKQVSEQVSKLDMYAPHANMNQPMLLAFPCLYICMRTSDHVHSLQIVTSHHHNYLHYPACMPAWHAILAAYLIFLI